MKGCYSVNKRNSKTEKGRSKTEKASFDVGSSCVHHIYLDKFDFDIVISRNF